MIEKKRRCRNNWQRNYLKKEVLFKSDVEALIGKRPYEEKKILDIDTTRRYCYAELPPTAIPEELKNPPQHLKFNMAISPAKENILKKIRQALSNPVPLPFPHSEGANLYLRRLRMISRIIFAEEFTKLQGKFAFCTDEQDL